MSSPARDRRNSFPWNVFLGVVLLVLCGSAGAVFGLVRWLRQDLPAPERVAAIQPAVKTTVYDVRGRVLHEFYRENRSPVALRKIPPHLVRATIATEDRAFYRHWGVDVWGVARAALTDVMHMKRSQGGSTITQQLARNLFLTHERTFSRKLKETALAVELERTYSKDEILEMYFNQIYFGDGAYGVEAAAKTYFAKPLSELSLAECALLAGLPANPSLYNPRRRPDAVKLRRGKVLRNMLATSAITKVEFDRAMLAPLGVTAARYSNDRAPYFIELVRQQLDERYGTNAVYEGGLRVHTTLDMDLQSSAERALERQLAQLEQELKLSRTRANFEAAAVSSATPYLQGAVVALDSRSGQVRALVGGRDYSQSSFNRATQARRQPGSAFKPIVFASAVEHGFKPTDLLVDEPVNYPSGDGKPYEPQNYDRRFRGQVTLRYALQQSINIPAVKLLKLVGPEEVISCARRLGIRSPLGSNLSLALGSSEVTLMELTSAYAVFASRGIRNDPVSILRVEDRHGSVLERATPRPSEALSEESAATMTSMLQSVVDHGTGYGARARGLTVPAAGKTGTMDDYKDAWFIGFTPSLVCGVWVGFDEKRVIGRGMTGAHAALPVWSEIMLGYTRGRALEDFPRPAGTVIGAVCSETGLSATDQCPNVTTEMFQEGSQPVDLCSLHPGRPLGPSGPRPGRDTEEVPPEPRERSGPPPSP